MRLILASSSPYRQDMLKRLGLPFTAIAPHVDESPLPNEHPADLAIRLSRAKAAAVAKQHPGALVIGSDQVASFDGQCLGKPGTHLAAVDQLRRLSGRSADFALSTMPRSSIIWNVKNPTTLREALKQRGWALP